MKKLSYLLVLSCACWVVGWTLLTAQFSKTESSPTEQLTEQEKAPKKELTKLTKLN
jgi:hypothetical protein